MYAVIAVFNSLSVRGRSRYTAAKVHSDFLNALCFVLIWYCHLEQSVFSYKEFAVIVFTYFNQMTGFISMM